MEEMNNMYLESIPDRYQVFCKEYPSLSLCRVILQEKGLYQVISQAGVHQARVSGKLSGGKRKEIQKDSKVQQDESEEMKKDGTLERHIPEFGGLR